MITIPIEVSARHLHINREDLDILFGTNYQQVLLKSLSQTGEFAAQETVTIKNADNEIINVRMVGPIRQETQVELSAADARKLRILPPVNVSGNALKAALVTIVGPINSITKECVIIPQRHIHASLLDAEQYNLHDGQLVSVKCGQDREVIFSNVVVRVHKDYIWNFHIDVDEANAAGIVGQMQGQVII